MRDEPVVRVAIVGAGPRGLSVLERLLANHAANPVPVRLNVHLIDPHQPGPGHVWNPRQSRLFLMNTPALFPTVIPGSTDIAPPLPAVADMTFERWTLAMRAVPDKDLTPQDIAELNGLSPADYPSRALYGRYLGWIYNRLRLGTEAGTDAGTSEKTGRVTVSHHAAEATRISPPGRAFNLALVDGTVVEADAVVLALGHLPAALGREQQRLHDLAGRTGLQHWPPSAPGDVDWSRLPARRPVLVRGLGLNFFDLMVQVTEGRGGIFVPAGAPARAGALRYDASGAEPVLIAASRRGAPYRAKAVLAGYLPASVKLRFCTAEAAGQFKAAGVQPGFDHDLWPLLHRDVLWTYYSVLARVSPSTFPGGAAAFLAALDELLVRDRPGSESTAWLADVEELVCSRVPGAERLTVTDLGQPFAGIRFSSGDDCNRAVLDYLDADAAGSAAGEDDPLKMAIGALNAGRSLLKSIVSDGGITEASWLAELRGWFEPLVEGLASGPPVRRIEQLAALVRAGIVSFVGPDPAFTVDEESMTFVATSPWVEGTEHRASYLVEAMTPPNLVHRSLSPLLRRLLADGLVRPRLMMAGGSMPVVTSGLDVTTPPYRAVDSSGAVSPGLFVIGLQLSSVQLGTAIAAEAGGSLESGARTLRDADRIALAVLSEAWRQPAPSAGPDPR